MEFIWAIFGGMIVGITELDSNDSSKRLMNGIAIVVVAVWALSTIVDMIPNLNYDPPVGIYPALMLVLGGIFGVRIVRGDNNK